MMKTPDEIKKALECCFYDSEQCGECPYYPVSCDRELVRDAREYIRQLEAERDRLVDTIRVYGGCEFCLHSDCDISKEPCLYCLDNERWQWCGVHKEETK